MLLQLPSQYLKTVFKNDQKFWTENIHNLASTCNKSIPHPLLNSGLRKKMEGGSFKSCSDFFIFFFLILPQSSPTEKRSRDVLQQLSSLPSQCS